MFRKIKPVPLAFNPKTKGGGKSLKQSYMKIIAGLVTLLIGIVVCIFGAGNGSLLVIILGVIVVITGFKVLTS